MTDEIVAFELPIAVASKALGDGSVELVLSDVDGLEVFRLAVAAKEAESVYRRLRRTRARLAKGLEVVSRELTRRPDARRPRDVEVSFDGCEAASPTFNSDAVFAPIGCAALIVVGLWFVFPTIALLAIGVILLTVTLVAFAALGLVLTAFDDRRSCCVRVLNRSNISFRGPTRTNGFGYLNPLRSLAKYRPKFVCYAHVADRVIIAAAEPSPSRAARYVAREALRQERRIARAALGVAVGAADADRISKQIVNAEADEPDQRSGSSHRL